jgi:hypothetical protein
MMMSKPEGWAMETKPTITRYPLCRQLGIISYPKGEPRVTFHDLKQGVTSQTIQEFEDWCGGGITQDSLGIYAWDVEDFLAGRPNLD